MRQPKAESSHSSMIEVTQLAKHFHDRKRGIVKAVDGVSFTCRPGEIFGLLGVNGAGKTTTLRILATLLKPNGGSAVIDGADVLRECGFGEDVIAELVQESVLTGSAG